MKTIRLLVTVSLIALLAGFNSVVAQTQQIELHASFDNGMVWCLNKILEGSWTYHINFHVNKKTGEVDNLHWNIKHCNLVDSDGNKYKAIDTGHSSSGDWWDFFNKINFYNDLDGTGIQFDEPADGFLDPYWPTNMPNEGSFENMFKFVGNGDVYYMHYVTQLHRKANGAITVDIVNVIIDCNE
jgi:hypothetical protein